MNATNEVLNQRTTQPARTLLPRTDIYAGDESTLLVCELPGVAEADVDVRLDGDVLHVSAKTSWSAPEALKLVHAEFENVNYERRFRLGENLDRDSIRAQLRDGLLRIELRSRAPSARRIPIQSASETPAA